MYPYKKLFLAFLLFISLTACASPSKSESEPKIYQIEVPSYITNEAVMDTVAKSTNVNQSTRLYVVTEEHWDDVAIDGIIGIFVASNLIRFDERQFIDYGQECSFNSPDTYRLKEGHLVVKYDPTTYDENFLEFCQSQIPSSLKAIFVYLDPRENNKVIKFFSGNVEVVAKPND